MEPGRRLKYLQVIFIVLLVPIFLLLWGDYNQNQTVQGVDLSRIPKVIEGWEAMDLPKNDDDQRRADSGDLVIRQYNYKEDQIYLVAIQERGDRHRVHSPLNCYTGSGWNLLEKREVFHSSGFYVRRLFVQKEDAYRLVYYWFTNGNTHSTGFLEHLMLYAKDMITGQRDTAWVYFDVSGDIYESVEKTESQISAFVSALDHQRLFRQGY